MPKIPDDLEKCKVYTASKPKPVQPDWEALRAKRNKEHQAVVEALAKKLGWDTAAICTTFDPNSCYCNCGTHNESTPNLCEHLWNGPEVTLEDGHVHSSTCSRCGTSAYSHDIRTAP